MFKKVISLSLAAVMSFSLAACTGSKTANTEKSAEKTVQSTPEATKAPVSSEKKKEDYKGEIVIWNWQNQDDFTGKVIPDFNKVYPNIKVKSVPVENREYFNKISTAVAAGSDLPDVVLGELNFRGTIFEMGFLDNLEQAPYNVKKSDIVDAALPLAMNSKGELLGVPDQLNPSGMAFRRPTAKQYLGTEDPKEIEKMFANWDQFIEKMKEVKQKSGGKVFAFRCPRDVFHIVDGYNPTNPIDGNKLKFKEVYLPTFKLMERMLKEGIVDKMEMWKPEWFAAFNNNDNYLFAASAPWFSEYIIKPNDKDGSGKWGLTVPPGGYFNWGGGALSIPKKSKVKELAWQWISYGNLTLEGAKNAFKNDGVLSAYKPVYDDPKFFSKPQPYFGGQDVGTFYMEGLTKFKAKKLGKYDNYLEANFEMGIKALIDGKTAEQAIKLMEDDMLEKVPELSR